MDLLSDVKSDYLKKGKIYNIVFYVGLAIALASFVIIPIIGFILSGDTVTPLIIPPIITFVHGSTLAIMFWIKRSHVRTIIEIKEYIEKNIETDVGDLTFLGYNEVKLEAIIREMMYVDIIKGYYLDGKIIRQKEMKI